MFQVHCPAHRSQVLLTARRITVMVNTLDGVVVHWRCWCGHPGRSLMGRRLDGPSRGTPAERRVAADAARATDPALAARSDRSVRSAESAKSAKSDRSDRSGAPAHAHSAGGRDARGDGCSGCPDGTWPAAS